jgi:hypothetical protein
VTDINQLSTSDTLTAGDLLPIWRTNNSDTRKTSLTTLQAYMQANLNFSSGGAGQVQFVVQYAAPVASGFTITMPSNSNNQWLILTPLAGYAAGTITFPLLSTLADNQEILIFSTQSVTALTLAGNGATIIGAPSTIAQFGALRFKFNLLTNAWYRLDETIVPRYEYIYRVLANAGQTVFTLPSAYSLNANAVEIYVNGLRVEQGVSQDWVETNTTTITFNSALTSGDLVVFIVNVEAYTVPIAAFPAAGVSAFGASLIDDADAAAGRLTLGLGTVSTLNTINNGNWSGAALTIANGGTGSTTANAALTALGGQPLDATLTALAAVNTATDQLVYSTGVDTFATTSFTSFGRTIAGSAQQSTTGTATGFTAGGGTNATDASTFTGGTGATAYRISDIVKALKAVGILAP